MQVSRVQDALVAGPLILTPPSFGAAAGCLSLWSLRQRVPPAAFRSQTSFESKRAVRAGQAVSDEVHAHRPHDKFVYVRLQYDKDVVSSAIAVP